MATTDHEPCEILEWDTDFFGFRVARVRWDELTEERVQQIDTWCNRNGVCCLYFLSRADDANTTRVAEDNDFRLMDVRLTLEYRALDVTAHTTRCTGCHIAVRHVRPEDVNMLRRIARESYHDTRFYCDPNFPRHLCESLYQTWIELSCRGYADAVLVAHLDDVPVGYVACHLGVEACTGRIGLVGVSSQAQGQGVGQALVLGGLEWLSNRGAQDVLVVTQGRNTAAQRLYQRCGFLTRDVQLWYHKWYTPSEAAYE